MTETIADTAVKPRPLASKAARPAQCAKKPVTLSEQVACGFEFSLMYQYLQSRLKSEWEVERDHLNFGHVVFIRGELCLNWMGYQKS